MQFTTLKIIFTVLVLLGADRSWAVDGASKDHSPVSKSPGNAPVSPVAVSPSVQTPTRPQTNLTPWNGPEYKDCQFSCLYDRANENITLSAYFTQTKYKMLEANQSNSDFLKENLKGFCGTQEDGKDCFNRYKVAVTVQLRGMQNAIIQNENQASQFKSRRVGINGEAEGQDVPVLTSIIKREGDPVPLPKKAAPIFLPTLSEIQSNERPSRIDTSDAYERWVKSIPREPSPTDFIKFKEIYRDPDNPSAGHLMVIIKDKKGNPVIDQTRYEVALAKYLEKKAQINLSYQKVQSDRPSEREKISDLGEDLKGNFNEMRRGLVRAVNAEVLKPSVPVQKDTKNKPKNMKDPKLKNEILIGTVKRETEDRTPAEVKTQSREPAATGDEKVLESNSGNGARPKILHFDQKQVQQDLQKLIDSIQLN